MELTLDNVKELLSKNHDIQYQEETNQLYMVMKVQGLDFPLFIRVYDEGDLLQLILFIPITLQPSTTPDLARLLHTLNKEIDIPGFGMDESSKVVFYRIMLPSYNKQIEEGLIEMFMSSLPLVAESFAPIIVTAASGNATYDEIMKKMADIEKS
jgi:hypothetical protein